MLSARTYCKQWVLEVGLTTQLHLPTPVDPTIWKSQATPNLGITGESKCFWGCEKSGLWAVGRLGALQGICPPADPENSSLSLARLGKVSRKMAIAPRWWWPSKSSAWEAVEDKTEEGHCTRPASVRLSSVDCCGELGRHLHLNLLKPEPEGGA